MHESKGIPEKLIKLFYILILSFWVLNLNSHSGGLNKDGCHNDNKTAEYHCHNLDITNEKNEVRVIDGDTIYTNFGKKKIRFNGIDAPEIGQICIIKEEKFDCGQLVKLKLKEFIGNGKINCIEEGKDFFGRTIAECFVNNKSISKYLVRNGYAFAYRKYSNNFIEDEDYARKNKLGLWKSEFQFPWDFRKNN